MKTIRWTWKNVSLPEEQAEKLGLRFEAAVIEAHLQGLDGAAATKEEIELLAHLGDLYSQLGELEKNLEVDLKLVRLRPRSHRFHYNLACTYSRLGNVDAALDALRRALELGYHNFEHLRHDVDLENLKKDKRFQKLLRRFDEQLESSA